ncbi:hypothetical protein D3C85_916100 [compost metagenome]
MQHRQTHLDGAAARIHVLYLQALDDEGSILLRHLRGARQQVDGGIVDRLHLNGQHVCVAERPTAAGVAQIIGHHGQIVIAVEVAVALIGHATGEQGVEIRQGASQHQRAGAVASQGHAAACRQVEGAVLHRQAHLHGAAARVHVLHLQSLDDEGLVLLGHLGIRWQHVDGGVVDRAHLHLDGATDLGAEGAVVQALGRHLEIQGAIGVVGHQLHGSQLAARRGHLPDAAAQIHHSAGHPARQTDLCPIGNPCYGDPHLLRAVLVNVGGAAAGGLGVLGLQPQVEGDHVPLGAARLVLNVGDDDIPHRLDGDGEAALGLEGHGEPLIQGEGAQGELHVAAEVGGRDQGQLGEVCAHRHLPYATAVVDRRCRQGEAVRHALDLQRHYLLGAIIVDQGRA